MALIFSSAQNMEIIGNKGSDAVEEACELQPDLLLYELGSKGNDVNYFVVKTGTTT